MARGTIGLIGGTGADFSLENAHVAPRETPYGTVEVTHGTTAGGTDVAVIARHGENQQRLSHQVTHRANIDALAQLGVRAILATTACGSLDPTLPLAVPVVFDDLLFTDNRLPDGTPCTFHDTPGAPGRGHLIAPSHFSPAARNALIAALDAAEQPYRATGCYSYALGPRFNSKAEIRLMQTIGATTVSQTAGPEAVLAAEREIPYALLGVATDYANGVSEVPTPVAVLDRNIAKAGRIFDRIICTAADQLAALPELPFDTGFNYRFF